MNTILTLTFIFISLLSGNETKKSSTTSEKNISLPEIVSPDFSMINTSNLREENLRFIVYTLNENNERNFVAHIDETIGYMNLKNDTAIKRSRKVLGSETNYFMDIVSKNDLKPIMFVERTEDQSKVVNFGEWEIEENISTPNLPMQSNQKAVEAPYFNAQSADLILRSLPLTTGYSARFVTYATNSEDKFEQTSVSVIDEIKTKVYSDQPIDAWVLSVESKNEHKIYHISKVNREILRVEFHNSDSSDILVMERF